MKGNQIVAAIAGGAMMLLSFSGCSTEPTSLPVEESKTSQTSSTTTSGQSTTTENRQTTTTTTSSTKETETTTTTQATKVQTTAEKTTIPTKSTVTKTTTTTSSTKVQTTTTTYTPMPLNPEQLSAEQEQQIKKDYLTNNKKYAANPNITVDNIRISRYVGTYHGCTAVFVDGVFYYTQAIRAETVAEYTIIFNDGNPLLLYKNGEFKQFANAYKDGWITREDVRDIQWRLNGK